MSATDSQPEPETRSVTEVILRATATHIFALANYGHLGSLTKLPKDLHVGYVAVFFLYPTIIIGQLVYGFWAAARYGLADGETEDSKADLCFYIQGLMGVHALPNARVLLGHGMDDESPVPLLKAGHRSVQRATYRISWKWFGRVLVCLLAVTQAIGTAVLFVRRINHETYSGGQLMIDTFTGVAALGSAVSGIMALLILLMRLEWQVISPVQNETLEHPRLTAMGAQLVIVFFCMGWIRGYLFWYLLYGPYLLFGMGHPLEVVVVSVFVYIFRQDILKRIGVSMEAAWSFTLYIFVLIIAGDIVMSIVTCILELTSMDDGGWKDPLSDKLLVI